MRKLIDVQKILRVLEMPSNSLYFPPGIEAHQAIVILGKFKDTASKQRKALAVKYHPDKEGGSQEKMQEINEAFAELKEMRIIPKQRPPQPRVTTIRVNGMYGFGGSTQTSTAFNNIMDYWHTVNYTYTSGG